MRRFSFVSVILFFCLAPFFVIGIVGAVKTYAAIRQLNSAEGIITDNVARIFADGTSAYVPKIKFTTAAGTAIFFTGNTGAIPAVYKKGENVAVLYDPLQPKDARINSFRELWVEDTCFIGISLLVFITICCILPKDLL